MVVLSLNARLMFDYVYYIIKQGVSGEPMLYIFVCCVRILCFSPERLIIHVILFGGVSHIDPK